MRKAQITMFIIVGLVLLLGVALSIGVLKNVLREKPPEEQVIADVPVELKPLGFAIEQCQDKILKEGAKKLLSNGGYINTELHGIIGVTPGSGNGFKYFDDSSIPYWHYIDSGELKSKRPDLINTNSDSVAAQLSAYVDERLEDCIPWESFPQYTINRGSLSSSVSFSDEITTITSTLPLEIDTQLGTTNLYQFQAAVDVPIKHLFDAGQGVIEMLELGALPEGYTLDWLDLYANGNNELPPIHGTTELSYNIKAYPLQEAQKTLAEVLVMMADSMTVLGSKDAHLFTSEDPTIQDLYLGGAIQLLPLSASTNGIDVSDTRIRFHYVDEFGMMLRVNGNAGAALPETMSAAGPLGGFFPPMVRNNFVYDISYPLHISLEKNGYVLNLGYEVNINDNQPSEADEDSSVSDDYCVNSKGADVRVTSNVPLEADLLYSCGSITCSVGKLVDGSFEGTLPSCASGDLEAISQIYFSEPMQVTSTNGDSLDLHIDFAQPRRTKIKVRQFNIIETPGEEDHEYEYQLSSTPSVTPIPTRVILSRHGKPLFATPDENDNVDLVPGVYDVFVVAVLEFPEGDPFIIPEETRDIDVSLIPGPSVINNLADSSYTINQTNFSSVPVTYLELADDRAITIDVVPSELQLNAIGIPLVSNNNRLEPNWVEIEQVNILSEIFNEAALIEESDAVTLIN